MTDKQPQIDRLEKIIYWMFIAAFLMAIKYLADALQFVTDEPVSRYLYVTESIIGFGVIVFALPSLIRLLYLRYSGEFNQNEPESYMVDSIRKTCVRTTGMTFLFIMIVRNTEKFDVYELPTKFTLDIILTFALASFSLMFFFQQWKLRKLEAVDELYDEKIE